MTLKSEMEDVFFRDKPVQLFMNIVQGNKPKYISVLSKKTDCTYSHTVRLLDKFEKMGFVTFEKEGRVKYVKLTEEGEKLAKAFRDVLAIFSRIKNK